MPATNNPVLGYIQCPSCPDRCTVHQAQRGKGRYLYTRCTNCGADQRTGKAVQRHWLENTEWLEGPPETLPHNLAGDYDPAATEPPEKRPDLHVVPDPEPAPGPPVLAIVAGVVAAIGGALMLIGGKSDG